MRLAIYEWDAWHQFMLVRMVPEAIRLTAHMGEDAAQILDRLPPAIDALAFHLNLTRTSEIPVDRPVLAQMAASCGIVVLNGSVTDISKKAVQAQCRSFGLPSAEASRDGDPAEQLFIKTDLNFGGRAERRLTPEHHSHTSPPAVSEAIPDWDHYHVRRRDAIPPAWWDDRALVIERFIDNRLNQLYRVNFAGDHAVILRLTNPHPIKKIYSSVERLDIYCHMRALAEGAVPGVAPAVARAVVRYIECSAMDFGALEVIPDDAGDAYIVDVNSTCYAAILNVWILNFLRRGLADRIATRAAAVGRPAPIRRASMLPTYRMLREEARRLTNQLTTRFRSPAVPQPEDPEPLA
jgi:hypothetical protein